MGGSIAFANWVMIIFLSILWWPLVPWWLIIPIALILAYLSLDEYGASLYFIGLFVCSLLSFIYQPKVEVLIVAGEGEKIKQVLVLFLRISLYVILPLSILVWVLVRKHKVRIGKKVKIPFGKNKGEIGTIENIDKERCVISLKMENKSELSHYCYNDIKSGKPPCGSNKDIKTVSLKMRVQVRRHIKGEDVINDYGIVTDIDNDTNVFLIELDNNKGTFRYAEERVQPLRLICDLKRIFDEEGVTYREVENELRLDLPNKFGQLSIVESDEEENLVGLIGYPWHTHVDCLKSGDLKNEAEIIADFMRDVYSNKYSLTEILKDGKSVEKRICENDEKESLYKYLQEGEEIKTYN